jgi:predicted nuclease of restriction endonuclease-like (RecB) superfamily
MNLDINYKIWIASLKDKIRSAQIKAALSVNEQMIMLYWDIGKSIVEAQVIQQWGTNAIEQIAKDLKLELPEVSGFSQSNLYVMRRFYLFYKDSKLVHQASGQLQDNDFQSNIILQQAAVNLNDKLVQQPVGLITKQNILCKIPWWHHQVILTKCKNEVEATFYIQQTIQNNWSRNVLQIQIESKLIDRQGKAQNNFEITLPKPQSDLAKENLKDPYKFDFLTLEADVQELELEKQLTENITNFLLELGKGFAFVGRQYPLQIGNKERKLDLLFYHLKMHCYVVIDLKMGEFEPEFAGKMNFYLSAVDDLLKTDVDQPSIGIILCKSKDSLDVEYALRDINKPLGISEFTFNELPENIQKNMPTVEELENELKNKF